MDDFMVAYYKRARIRRVERTILYSCLVASGIFLTISPSPLVRNVVSVQVEYFWSIAMIVCSIIAFWGNATDRWIGEYTALPLLSVTLFFYAGTAFLAWHDDKANYTLMGFGFLLLAFGLSLLARWRDIILIKKHAEDLPRSEV